MVKPRLVTSLPQRHIFEPSTERKPSAKVRAVFRKAVASAQHEDLAVFCEAVVSAQCEDLAVFCRAVASAQREDLIVFREAAGSGQREALAMFRKAAGLGQREALAVFCGAAGSTRSEREARGSCCLPRSGRFGQRKVPAVFRKAAGWQRQVPTVSPRSFLEVPVPGFRRAGTGELGPNKQHTSNSTPTTHHHDITISVALTDDVTLPSHCRPGAAVNVPTPAVPDRPRVRSRRQPINTSIFLAWTDTTETVAQALTLQMLNCSNPSKAND
ncbi:hypothetical protein C8R43DRAFT_1122939 [Mycena crocata]|nr:hypothetical protein C8R43DRAFT_1122939 [Mycena crocata]